MDILFNQITCDTRPSPLPYVPPATQRKHSQSSAWFIVSSSDPPCTPIGFHLTRVQRKFHLFPNLPELSENTALCGMQTRQALVPPLVTLDSRDYAETACFLSPGMNCSQQRLWNWCIAVYFYTSSEQLHTQSCINSILSPASGSSPWYSEI